MSIYGGFEPGTFQPWALNLSQQALGSAGVAHGMSVVPSSPAGMSVQVSVDPTWGDGVCYLPNGAFLRIDAPVTLTVPATTGSGRTDAVLAYVDPTGTTASSVFYQTNWTGNFASSGNQFVLAQVTVPNGASSIIASNIANTPLAANIGSAPPTVPDGVVAETNAAGGAPGVYVAQNVVLTSSALSNQTSFAAPLTSVQRLVQMGKIGGADEVGVFASRNGWYVPQVVGSVSGPLPIASVDPVGGNLVTSVGAQAGEQVTASYKYYDFSRDLQAWANGMRLEHNSPYVVYTGDVAPGRAHQVDDLWNTPLPAALLPESGTVVTVTFWGLNVAANVLVPTGGVSLSSQLDGANSLSVTVPGSTDLGPYATCWPMTTAGGTRTAHVATLTTNQPGVEVHSFLLQGATANNGTVYQMDGGEGVVQGFQVLGAGFQQNSFSSPTNAAGEVGNTYLLRSGGITTTFVTLGTTFAEQTNGRIPLAQALQYGAQTNLSTQYGLYALPDQPVATYVGAGAWNTTAQYGGGGQAHGWKQVTDATSPYGVYLSPTSANDVLQVTGWCSGMDVLLVNTNPVTATLHVYVDNPSGTNYTTYVGPNSSGARLRLTAFSSLPLGSHAVSLVAQSGMAGLGFEAVDLRVPQTPPAPVGTLPLHRAFVPGSGNYLRLPSLHLTTISVPSGNAKLLSDANRPFTGPTIGLSNVSTNQTYQQVLLTGSTYRFTYFLTPNQGKVNLVLDNTSTVTTIDPFGTTFTATSTPWYNFGGAGRHTLAVAATATKNSSASALSFDGGQFDVMPPILFTDQRRYVNDGVRPAARGSALVGARGEKLYDAASGVSTAHLADRVVTSRKLAPTTAQAIATTAWTATQTSPVPAAIDPYLACGITVEVPSLLVVSFQGFINLASNAGCQGYLVLDGQNQVPGGSPWTVFNSNATRILTPIGTYAFLPVGPGSHTVQTVVINYAAGTPYYDGTSGRFLNLIAFAL